MAINEIPKPISSLIFEDFLGNEINLKDYHGKLVIINFGQPGVLLVRKKCLR